MKKKVNFGFGKNSIFLQNGVNSKKNKKKVDFFFKKPKKNWLY